MKEAYQIKEGGFVRYFYDAIGQIIGRIDTDENGDGFAYDAVGNLLGKSFEGRTYNQVGEVVAQSDILPSLLVQEHKVVSYTIKKAIDVPERPLSPPEGAFDQDEIDKEIKDNVYNLVEEYFQKHKDEPLFLHDQFIETDLYADYMEWVHENFTPEQIEKEDYLKNEDFLDYFEEYDTIISEWMLKNDKQFKEWAEDKIITEWSRVGYRQAAKFTDIAVNKDAEGTWFAELSDDATGFLGKGSGETEYAAVMKAMDELEEQQKKQKGGNVMADKKSYKIADVYDYYSIGIEDIGDEGEMETVPKKKKYTPIKRTRGKFNIGDTVLTPDGRGRIIRKQTEYPPFSYTVIVTGVDEPELYEEKQLRKVQASKIAIRPNDVRFSADAAVYVWIDISDLEYDDEVEKIKKSDLSETQKLTLVKERAREIAQNKIEEVLSRSGIEVEYDNLSIDAKQDRLNWAELITPEEEFEASSAINLKRKKSFRITSEKVGWLRDKWIELSKEVMDIFAEENEEFRKDYADEKGKGLDIWEYYTSSRYELAEKPYRDDEITKDQALGLLADMLRQFTAELKAAYGVSAAPEDVKESEDLAGEDKKQIKEDEKEKNEKESAIDDPSVVYKVNDVIHDNSAAPASSTHMRYLIEEIPHNPRAL